MITITFSDKTNGHAAWKHIVNKVKPAKIKPSFANFTDDTLWRLHIDVKKELHPVLDALVAYIREKEEEAFLMHIIGSHFLYADGEEQQMILAIAQSLIEGEWDIPELKNLPLIDDVIRESLHRFFLQPPEQFSMEAFIQFRLRTYFQQLKTYVECAIDEYKMELEYQLFVNHLRSCVEKRSPGASKIHLLFDGQFRLLDENYKEFSKDELSIFHEKALVVTKELDLDDRVLGPLIGLAPELILIYAKEDDHPLLHTVQNVFQEKISFLPLRSLNSPMKGIKIEKKS